MSDCELWSVCGTNEHCLIYKDCRYGHSNCMGPLLASVWNKYTGPSRLKLCCICAVTKSTLVESRQDDHLSLSASYIRVMPNVTFDVTGNIITKQEYAFMIVAKENQVHSELNAT